MFGRIMAVVVAVIVLLTSVLSGLGLYTLTSRQTAIRQENLRAEAREIAYLASLYSGGSSTYTLGTSLFSGSAQNTVALKHLRWKAAQVYDEYGAYIAIVDRSGQVMDNMAVTYEKNPDFAKTLNGKDIYEALLTIIGGDEISIRRQVDGDWYFTVGVPFVSGGLVRGAVFIQTPAQEIEVRAGTLLLPVLGVVLGFCILAGGAMLLYLRRILHPISVLSGAAKAMSEGNFSVRAPEGKATCPEIAELDHVVVINICEACRFIRSAPHLASDLRHDGDSHIIIFQHHDIPCLVFGPVRESVIPKIRIYLSPYSYRIRI